MAELISPDFWWALGQIVVIDLLLGGDNAVVIALACRHLPPAQRVRAIVIGTAAAVVLRVMLIVFALKLLRLPWLKLGGAALLVWIGVRLIAPARVPEANQDRLRASTHLWTAVRTITVADLAMSLDNVMAIAAAAQGAAARHHALLVGLGMLISVPIIVWGSQWVLRLLDRFPVFVVLGAMLLGWVAAGMAWSDPWLQMTAPMPWLLKSLGAVGVLLLGLLFRRRDHCSEKGG